MPYGQLFLKQMLKVNMRHKKIPKIGIFLFNFVPAVVVRLVFACDFDTLPQSLSDLSSKAAGRQQSAKLLYSCEHKGKACAGFLSAKQVQDVLPVRSEP